MRRFASFRDFYPVYLGEHSDRRSRRLHFLGSCGVIVFLLVALATGKYLVGPRCAGLWLRLRMDRAFRVREEPPGDIPHPWYSFLGDWVMFN